MRYYFELKASEDVLLAWIVTYVGWAFCSIGVGTWLGAPVGFVMIGLPLIVGPAILLRTHYLTRWIDRE